MNKVTQELTHYHDTEDDVAYVNFSLDFRYRLLNGWKLISHAEHIGSEYDKEFISAVWEKCPITN